MAERALLCVLVQAQRAQLEAPPTFVVSEARKQHTQHTSWSSWASALRAAASSPASSRSFFSSLPPNHNEVHTPSRKRSHLQQPQRLPVLVQHSAVLLVAQRLEQQLLVRVLGLVLHERAEEHSGKAKNNSAPRE